MYLKRDLKINGNKKVIDFCYDHNIDLRQFSRILSQINHCGAMSFEDHLQIASLTNMRFTDKDGLWHRIKSHNSDHKYRDNFGYKWSEFLDKLTDLLLTRMNK